MNWQGLVVASLLLAALNRECTAQEDGVERALAQGNEAYAAFDNNGALQHFRTALQMDPNNYEALWKAARACADVGKTFEERDRKQAKQLYWQGDSLARLAVKLHPDSAESHFALALCVGRVALFEGGKTKIRLSREVRKEAERTLALNPRHDGAYHILGRWHYNIATLDWLMKAAARVVYGGVPPGASLEEAAKMFAQAVALDGHKPVHRLEYGRTLIKLERYREAREQLQACLTLPRVQWDDPQHQAEAGQLLREIRDKRDKP
ncbi:MAG: hypothetical protein ONB48_19000 [candidate division KSB1 bacterium]|nr:hypothetical protein [candidate division KSB1 bacterium]MDZ7276311.1 hypothetical protein [candidate division KSB1 bacterium]MDZ7287736.1 hypothetical protein [candidate division KSB1 bacterium]MDZ7299924.1 hypothetical protein [candidate division KSB1 bacterium]MDZ7350923.1 hypothetical protein [candidate division KSB1 bacterium]